MDKWPGGRDAEPRPRGIPTGRTFGNPIVIDLDLDQVEDVVTLVGHEE